MRGWATFLLTSSLWSQTPLLDGFSHAEGLANDAVRCIASDARGFLWFGTGDGLSRSDGRRFSNYGFDQGLRVAQIDALATGPDRRLALGMHGPWLAVYDPTATPVLTSTRLRGDDLGLNVCAICAGNAGEWWFTSETGLFRASVGADGAASALRVVEDDRKRWYGTLARSSRSEIVYFNTRETVVVGDDGVARFPRGEADAIGNVWSALELGPGRWLVLEDRRLVELQLQPAGSTQHPVQLDVDARFTCLCSNGRGGYWLGTTAGLRELEAEASGGIRESMRILDGEWIRALALDRAGNLWIAGNTRGLQRRSGLPFTAIGLPAAAEAGMPVLLRATPRGLFGVCDRGVLVRAQDDRMVSVSLERELRSRVAASRSVMDGVGRLWLAERDALLVIRTEGPAPGAVERRFPLRVDSFACDSRGRVLGRAIGGAAFVVDPAADPAAEPQVLALPQDAPDGDVVWIDDESGVWIDAAPGLVRATPAGCVGLVDAAGAAISATRVVEDPRGRMWLIDTQRAEVRRVHSRHGNRLESDRFDLAGALPVGALVRAAADARGHLWIAGASGLLELDPDSGGMRRLQWPYRVIAGYVNSLAIASDGKVWIASGAGVFRFDPSAWRPEPEPTLFVDELSIAGVPVRLPDGGTDVIPDLVVPANTPAIELHFVAPNLGGDALRLQHRLRPIDSGFSQPTPLGSLRLAGLAGGDYQLDVRATTAGSVGAGPELSIAISVLRPFWRSPLFLSMAALTLAVAALGFHRIRVRRLLALERIRRRIAMDLHDDLGSGLAQVAVLSEAAKRRVEAERVGALDGIAQVARRLRASLGDIVWAVDPARDTVPELVHRLRDLAVSLFPPDAVHMRFHAPADAAVASVRMKPDRRRNLFLLAKEAFTNCARHAHATTVTIEIEVDQRVLRLRVTDDGVGFAAPAGGSGRGLGSMQARAAELGGSLRIDSAPGRGTVVALEAPL